MIHPTATNGWMLNTTDHNNETAEPGGTNHNNVTFNSLRPPFDRGATL